MKIFIASPLGFAESSKNFLNQLCSILVELNYDVVNPWELSGELEKELNQAGNIPEMNKRNKKLHDLSMKMAERNAESLRLCQGVLAVLDGVDVDSGTASEIGYAFGLGDKVINGYRGDFRRTGENEGVHVNLQVQYWIEKTGGEIVTSLEQIYKLKF